MKISMFHVDAFTDRVFSGNPGAVCFLDHWLDDQTMLAIAAENNVSETAFCVREGERHQLRWFAPASEVQLCGHATLATAFVLLKILHPGTHEVEFETCSGILRVEQDGECLAMDFPAIPATPCEAPPELLKGLTPTPRVVLQSGETTADRNYFVVYEKEEDVRNARPDFALLERLHPAGVCITAPGREVDVVSRYFAPSYGIPEDPVTGSTHCTLALYWAERLGREVLRASQISHRGGSLVMEARGKRVRLSGTAVLYLRGEVQL